MSEYIIRVIDDDVTVADKWLEWFDVDAMAGRGLSKLTDDKAKAVRFPTITAALDAWQTQSTVRPLREDGKPNRPLTAYTIEMERIP